MVRPALDQDVARTHHRLVVAHEASVLLGAEGACTEKIKAL
jgi:hypothetical protein